MEENVVSKIKVGYLDAIIKPNIGGCGYYGFIKELPGIISQGETKDELIKNLHKALASYLIVTANYL